MTSPRKDDDFSEEEARKRFEHAVDKALRTPPMHRQAKQAPPKSTAKEKKPDAKR